LTRFTKIIALLFFFSIFLISAAANIKDEKLTYNTIFVDAQNRLWLGTENGLYIWRNATPERVTSDSATIDITSIASFYNFLLLGTRQGELYSYSTDSKELKSLGRFQNEISAIIQSYQCIYIATKGNGYYSITSDRIQNINSQNGLRDDYLYSIYKDKKANIWCASDNGFSILNQAHQPLSFEPNQYLPDKLITCFDIKHDNLFFGTQKGYLCRINLTTLKFETYNRTIWHQAQLNDLIVLDHVICLATEDGAYIIDHKGNLVDMVVKNKPMKKVVADMEGYIWFVGNHILAGSTGEQLIKINHIHHTAVNNVHALYFDQSNSMWFTPDQGLCKYNPATGQLSITYITAPERLIDITAIYQDHTGILWVGTSGDGLYIVDTMTLKSRNIAIDPEMESSAILSINGDHDSLWVCSLNGIWSCLLNKIPYRFQSVEERYHTKKYYVYQVEKDHNNNLWMATDGQGILRIHHDSLENYSAARKIHQKVFFSIEEDGLGQVWFNAYNDGLYCKRGNSVLHLNESNGLLDNDVSSIIKYKNNYLVAASKKGIDLINTHSLAVSHIYFEDERLDEIPEINAIDLDADDRVNIGTNLGILQFYLPTYKTFFLPQIHIEEIVVMGKMTPKTIHNFPHNQNYFRFKIAGIHNSEDKIYYRYKLKGLSDGWNITTDKEIGFPGLNAGNYELVIQAANNPDFLNSTSDNYLFTITKPFWKTIWFLICVSLLCLASIYQYIMYREKRVGHIKQLENATVIAEFESLKQQVSPHFLFNSFNTLMQVIDNDTKEKALEYTQKLSDFYRSLISYRDADLVSLREELKLLDNYIYLQKMRLGNNLNLCLSIDENEKDEIEIPPLTLQLLAENAIKHNVISTATPFEINITCDHEYIIVRNFINKKRNAVEGEKLGLKNIINRYMLFTGLPVIIHHTEILFEVKIPVLKSPL